LRYGIAWLGQMLNELEVLSNPRIAIELPRQSILPAGRPPFRRGPRILIS